MYTIIAISRATRHFITDFVRCTIIASVILAPQFEPTYSESQ